MTVFINTEIWWTASIVLTTDLMGRLAAFAGTAASTFRVTGNRRAVVVVADIKVGAGHAGLQQAVSKDGVPWRRKSLLFLRCILRGGRIVGISRGRYTVTLANMSLGETALRHGGWLCLMSVCLCADAAVTEGVGVKATVIMDAGCEGI